MRTNYFSPIGLVIVLLLSCMAFFSCKKKTTESTPSNTPASSQRITEWATYDLDSLYSKDVYHYSGNNITEVTTYSSRMVKQHKLLLAYNGNQLSTITRYDTTGDTWIKRYVTGITAYSGSNPSEVVTQNYDQSGNETSKYKLTFTYTGNLLKGKTYYLYNSGSWTETEGFQYLYDNSSRILRMNYQSSNYNYNFSYTYIYQGNTMTTELDSSNLNGNLSITKYNCQYVNNQLSHVQDFDWNNNTWVLTYNETFQYNSEGNIINYQWVSVDLSYRDKEEFNYETRAGNFRLFAFIENGFTEFPGTSWPYPVKSTSTGPRNTWRNVQFISGIH